MTENEIKQVITNALSDAITPLMAKVAELNKPVQELTKEPETLEERLEATTKQWIEDKQVNRYGGKDLDYKPNNTLNGEGKSI